MTPYDPVLPPADAARYVGFRGKDPTRSLRRLQLERQPIPGTGSKRPRFGYRLSTLNALLERMKDPRSRERLVRQAS